MNIRDSGTSNYVGSVRALGDLSSALTKLAELAPERMTMSQGIFFLLTAKEDIAERCPTYSSIKAAVGDTINRSLHTTYRVLLEPSRAYPKGLGWLKQEPDPEDNRAKLLKLTTKGRKVVSQVVIAAGSDRAGKEKG